MIRMDIDIEQVFRVGESNDASVIVKETTRKLFHTRLFRSHCISSPQSGARCAQRKLCEYNFGTNTTGFVCQQSKSKGVSQPKTREYRIDANG